MKTPNWQHNSGKDKKGRGVCKGRLRSRKESLRQLKNRYMTSPKRRFRRILDSTETNRWQSLTKLNHNLPSFLATEDLVVEHRKVETACFNVHTRVLTLPMWEKASNEVYDMLVGHEVGHALYTPDEDWREEYDVSPQFVNIVEDARIEKLMKRRYAGIGKTFYRGYNELADEDFFCLENEDVNKMNLADRVNLYFKIGNFCDIYFREHDEMPIVRMIEGCETFADALLAAEVLYKFCKKESNEEQPNVNNSQKKILREKRVRLKKVKILLIVTKILRKILRLLIIQNKKLKQLPLFKLKMMNLKLRLWII